MTKIASSANTADLLKLINGYYYTTNCIINPDNTVINTKLNKQVGIVKKSKDRYIYYATQPHALSI